MALRLALFAPIVLAAGKSDGTCGYQCTTDSDCSGCGTAGACSCPDGADAKFPAISCTCVSTPANPPKDPESNVGDAKWPDKWTANVDGWVYADFTTTSANASTAKGKFFYDYTLGKQKTAWAPYSTGKDATQTWIVDLPTKDSKYYVKSGALCLYFPITDPGLDGTPKVGVEKADWMQSCKEAGMAKYIGREQVDVHGEAVWADHWACHVDYEAAGQQITFQNWHSLGLGTVPKGLPIRVTGGNSAPNGQKGSPRLSTVWYKDFDTSANATKPEDFVKPSGFCIPVGADEVKAHFGHDVQPSHTFDSAFHRRAHYLPHAKASARDLTRARRPTPGRAFQGDDFADTMQKLNKALLREKGLRTQKCESFSLEVLQEMQRELFNARTHQLDAVYANAGDTRRMAHDSVESLEGEQARVAGIKAPSLLNKARDGACHEMVMWYIHHLSDTAREEIKQRLVLPLLPEMQHEEVAVAEKTAVADDVHRRYTAQASCAVCHVALPSSVVV
jgi:hypothetical protein